MHRLPTEWLVSSHAVHVGYNPLYHLIYIAGTLPIYTEHNRSVHRLGHHNVNTVLITTDMTEDS